MRANVRTTPTPPRERWLSGGEVAEVFHVYRQTVAYWAKDGKLPFVKTLGGHRRYPESEILEIARSLEGPPP
jgi:excisionase family DNA binding protein